MKRKETDLIALALHEGLPQQTQMVGWKTAAIAIASKLQALDPGFDRTRFMSLAEKGLQRGFV